MMLKSTLVLPLILVFTIASAKAAQNQNSSPYFQLANQYADSGKASRRGFIEAGNVAAQRAINQASEQWHTGYPVEAAGSTWKAGKKFAQGICQGVACQAIDTAKAHRLNSKARNAVVPPGAPQGQYARDQGDEHGLLEDRMRQRGDKIAKLRAS